MEEGRAGYYQWVPSFPAFIAGRIPTFASGKKASTRPDDANLIDITVQNVSLSKTRHTHSQPSALAIPSVGWAELPKRGEETCHSNWNSQNDAPKNSSSPQRADWATETLPAKLLKHDPILVANSPPRHWGRETLCGAPHRNFRK